MIEIGMNNITKNYGFKNVLNGVSFEVMTGDRVALTGRNGSGKTTIFKLITKNENPTSGLLTIRKNASVGYLEQIPSLFEVGTTVKQVLLFPFHAVFSIEQQMQEIEQALTTETNEMKISEFMNQYALLQDEFIAVDGYSVDERFNKIVQGFSLTELLEKPFTQLSGGQKTIVQMAAVLLTQPDILLLDEPTNHLDIAHIEWLEEFIRTYRGTVFIISHDRYFLDRTTNKTIMLEKGTCTVFNGNYTYSLQEQEKQLLVEFEKYKTQQKKIDAMHEAIKRYREWGANGDNPKFFKKANELEKRLAKMDILDKPVLETKKLPLSFQGERSGKEVLQVKNASLAFGNLTLLHDASFTIYEKEKVCLLGENGSGKTSLLKAILSEQALYEGQIHINPSAHVGYIPQEIYFQNEKQTILQVFSSSLACSEQVARGILAKFFFYGETVFKRVSTLSGGEKVLLLLAILIQQNTNFLILDEPTNHIDIEVREMLEDALQDYAGTLLFISHDRYFINRLATRFLKIENQTISSSYGTYDDFLSSQQTS